ncbi:MAG: hypothetical protein U0792_11670 [Gemmataceae bacterium]
MRFAGIGVGRGAGVLGARRGLDRARVWPADLGIAIVEIDDLDLLAVHEGAIAAASIGDAAVADSPR